MALYKSIIIIIIIIIIITFGMISMGTMGLIAVSRYYCVMKPARCCSENLGYLSSTINPFVYGATNKQFSREYKAILRMIVCFRSENNDNSNNNS